MEQILVIDDDQNLVKLLSTCLKSSGYKTLEANNGKEGLEIARDKSPDLILMDINMPEVNGIEATNILKSDPKTAAIPIIMLTAQAEPDLVSQALVAGATDYLNKPFDTKILLEKIQTTLSSG